MKHKPIKKETPPSKPKDTFNVAGVEYKMVGVNEDGTPILKSLDKIKEEEHIKKLKQDFADILNKLYSKDVHIRVSHAGGGQSHIEIFDQDWQDMLKKYW